MDNKEECQTLVDKRITATLEKEIEFLSNNNQKNNNDNMDGEIWDFGDTFNTSDSHSVCSTAGQEKLDARSCRAPTVHLN